MTPAESILIDTQAVNAQRLTVLKAEFPEAFTEGKLDIEKLRTALDEVASEKGQWGIGDTAVNLVSLEDLDPVMDLVSQAYQLTV